MEETIKLWFKEGYTDFDSSEGLNRDHPFELKRLNVIVGANNSGKSRFMRSLGLKINSVQVDFYLSLSILNDLKSINDSFRSISSVDLNLDNLGISNYQSINQKLESAKATIKETRIVYENLTRSSVVYFRKGDEIPSKIHSSMSGNKDRFKVEAEKHTVRISNITSRINSFNFSSYNIFYIDTLRSLRKVKVSKSLSEIDDKAENTLFKTPLLLRTYEDYNFSENQITSGEDFFDFLTDSLLGMPEERQKVYNYQAKLSHYFFNNQDVILIPNRKDDILQIKIGDDKQFPISQLGDGLQQIIILTYKAFLTTEPSFFFIEEPEMHLHAGYVKQLMKFLLNETEHYYMMTSHSNYLLDMINEDKRIALYRVDKDQIDDEENKYETVIKRCDGDRTILKTLGVSPSSVFLANCTIWIEGITDRLYFVQYLKKYLEELKTTDEDKWKDYSRFIDGYHYAFVEYQGSNLEHWDFEVDSLEDVDSSKNKGLNAVLITSNALVIADSDLTKKPRFNELEQQLGDKIVITKGKETENSLPRNLLIKKFFEMCPNNGLANQGGRKKLEYSYDHENCFTDSYQTSPKGIGKYFDRVLEKMRKNEVIPELTANEKSFTFSDGGQGTIKGKTGFCRDIVESMQTEDWKLTDSAIELCEAIFQHIKRNNE
ncbi:ATP-dependent nuclease [Psychrobacter sp. NPDC064578]|uniref:AAA family ATPase n=1 Tax=Psychrobacter sp. NPDC064578 TaxID=3364493 RepID=UPI0038501976